MSSVLPTTGGGGPSFVAHALIALGALMVGLITGLIVGIRKAITRNA